MEGRMGKKRRQHAEENGSVAQEYLQVRVLHGDAIQRGDFGGANDPDEWERVDDGDDNQTDWDDDSHGRVQRGLNGARCSLAHRELAMSCEVVSVACEVSRSR